MISYKSPEWDEDQVSVFLAGGITGCPDWQDEVVSRLACMSNLDNLVIYNPRRDDFDVDSTFVEREQIEWEHYHLAKADVISFWFPKEGLCMITLLELGKWLPSEKELIIGCHPDYKRIRDVRIQTQLERPELEIHHTLDEHIQKIADLL